MAQLTHDTATLERVDFLLRYLFSEWTDVASLADEWDQLDMTQKEDFHHEWVGSTEMLLRKVDDLYQRGCMTSHQQQSYDQLIELVNMRRPLVARLLQS